MKQACAREASNNMMTSSFDCTRAAPLQRLSVFVVLLILCPYVLGTPAREKTAGRYRRECTATATQIYRKRSAKEG